MPVKAGIQFRQKISPSILFGIFFLCLFCAPVPADDAFVTAYIAEPSNLLPFLATDSASAEVSRLVFNGLVKYDENLKLTGDLAESWEVTDAGKTLIFHLRKNVFWQDGEPFSSKDVLFTYQKLTDPSVPTPYSGDFEKIQSVETPDALTVKVIYREPFSPGVSSWSMGIVPEHLLAGEDLRTTAFSRKPIGTGPYILKKWNTGESIELWANPHYFERKPGIGRYVYRIIPDQSTAFLELLTENIDAAGLTPLQYKRQTDKPAFTSRFQKYRLPSFSYAYIGYNLDHPIFSDRRVRKALGLAIHKQDIIDVSLLGFGRVATGPYLPESWAYNRDIKPAPFDPAAASALLKEAGWADADGDGILDREGRNFQFTLLTNQGNDQRKMACEIIQKRLRDIGIDMKIQVVEWSTFLKEFIDKRRFDAVLLAWQMQLDPDIYDIFHSSRTGPGQFNFVGYKNPEVDGLLEEGRRVFPEDQRARVYRRVHEILAEDEPYTFLYVPESLSVLHRRFKGIRPSPIGIAHNFIHWQVPPAEQKYRLKEN